MYSSLVGKVCIITGASSGIGKATAIHFAKLGCRLSLVGRNEKNLLETKKECLDTGKTSDKDVLTVLADVSIESDNESIVAKTIEHFKKIDILINNAGHVIYDSLEKFDVKGMDEMLRVHIRAVAHLTHLVTPQLILNKGNVVNVSSVNGIRPFKNFLSYTVAKAAEDHFTRCAAMDLAPKGVRVNSVNPGVIETDAHKRAGMDEKTVATLYERSKDMHPLGRHGEPEEVAKAIAFLASDEASFITSVILPVDGGHHDNAPR